MVVVRIDTLECEPTVIASDVDLAKNTKENVTLWQMLMSFNPVYSYKVQEHPGMKWIGFSKVDAGHLATTLHNVGIEVGIYDSTGTYGVVS